MILMGLLLVVAAAVFGLDLLWKNSFRVQSPVVFGQSLGMSSGRWLFLIGAVAGAVFVLGLALLLGGLRRKAAKVAASRRLHRADRSTGQERDELQAENEQLRRRLDDRSVSEQLPVSDERQTLTGGRAGASIPVRHDRDHPVTDR
jgi:hypothetical protein